MTADDELQLLLERCPLDSSVVLDCTLGALELDFLLSGGLYPLCFACPKCDLPPIESSCGWAPAVFLCERRSDPPGLLLGRLDIGTSLLKGHTLSRHYHSLVEPQSLRSGLGGAAVTSTRSPHPPPGGGDGGGGGSSGPFNYQLSRSTAPACASARAASFPARSNTLRELLFP